ncbi:PTS system polysaccharide transporter [Ignavibacterium album JCM 16511]|uniref:PTS system polysaccharide transporter n=2 Tax=Ignavibacterium album TaxID=591197 RepID=I0AJH0_IGNAJ|nr:PTS system polysaccharide transporter [Ignavibacterium album JCM 16511]
MNSEKSNNLKQFKFRLLNSKLFNDSFWAIFGNFAGKGLSLLAGIFIAKILGKDIFGEFSIIKGTVISFSMLSTFGLGYSSTKFISEQITDKSSLVTDTIKSVLTITFLFSSIIGAIIYKFSNDIALALLNAPQLNIILKIVSLWIIFNALTTSQIGILSGLGKFRSLAKINILVGFFLFCLSIFLTYFFRLFGAVYALLISQIINFILNSFSIQKSIQGFPKSSKRNLELNFKILKFSIPVTLQELLYGFSTWLTSIIFVQYLDYGQLGLYNAAIQISSIILYIPGILRNVILNHFSKTNSNKSYQILLFKRVIFFNLVVTMIPVLFVIIFGQKITEFYGTSYQGLEILLILSSITTIFASIGNVLTQYYLSIGKNWTIFFFRAYRDIIGLLTFLLIVNYFSLENATKTLLILNLIFQSTFVLLLMINIKKYNCE